MSIQGQLRIEYIPLAQLRAMPKNPKAHDLELIAGSVFRFGFNDPVTVDETTGYLCEGHGRLEAMEAARTKGPPEDWPDGALWPPAHISLAPDGDWLLPVVRGVSFETEDDLLAYLVVHNQTTTAGGFNQDRLRAVVAEIQARGRVPLPVLGFRPEYLQRLQRGLGSGGGAIRTGPDLADAFLAPPFTVLDARQGYWRQRKTKWQEWGAGGQRGAEGREHLHGTVNRVVGDGYNASRGTTAASTIDPVLCELMYRWYGLAGGSVLDPFAGGSTAGLVAGRLGYEFTGLELRREQVEVNQQHAAELAVTPAPTWICGDSAQMDKLLPKGQQYDLLWTSPPYYDLEVYSSKKGDGSTAKTYEQFMAWCADILTKAIRRLKNNRFAAFQVGESRDKLGAYHNFVGDIVTLMQRLGLRYYVDGILVMPLGSLPIRARRPFETSRKLAMTHQHVLVFYKGDLRQIRRVFPKVVCAADVFDSDGPDGDDID